MRGSKVQRKVETKSLISLRTDDRKARSQLIMLVPTAEITGDQALWITGFPFGHVTFTMTTSVSPVIGLLCGLTSRPGTSR